MGEAEIDLHPAQSPTGGGLGNPVWDFVFLRRDRAMKREFNFRVQAVYKNSQTSRK